MSAKSFSNVKALLAHHRRPQESSDQQQLPPQNRIPSPNAWSNFATNQRRQFVGSQTGVFPVHLCQDRMISDDEELRGNIEQYIGMTAVPTGLIGPVTVNGDAASGGFFVPLATTEGALVASYNRGARACTLAGGVQTKCVSQKVQRAPLFVFETLKAVSAFLTEVEDLKSELQTIIDSKSSHTKLLDLQFQIQGNQLILVFEFETGDAAGQNMVTFSTEALCKYILSKVESKPQNWYLESNFSGDKKASFRSFISGRGRKITAECLIPKEVITKVLKSTPEAIATYWMRSSLSAVQSGTIGNQGHFANGLAALFLATGQDVACVSESAVGTNRMELTPAGDLYVAINMPCLMVGTVGGGTHLPTQRECLELMGCYGTGKATKFAEIAAATALAGELSIAAAMSSGDFAKAHQAFGRK